MLVSIGKQLGVYRSLQGCSPTTCATHHMATTCTSESCTVIAAKPIDVREPAGRAGPGFIQAAMSIGAL